MTQSHSRTGDLTTSTGKLLLTAARKGAILVKRMSEALTLAGETTTVVIPANAGNQYPAALRLHH
jgi:hypothetical protein